MEKEILEDFEEQLKNCQLNGLDLEITDKVVYQTVHIKLRM